MIGFSSKAFINWSSSRSLCVSATCLFDLKRIGKEPAEVRSNIEGSFGLRDDERGGEGSGDDEA